MEPLGHHCVHGCPVRGRNISGRRNELRSRTPMLLLRLSGELLLRFADRQFWRLLFQLPPRMTRLELPFGFTPLAAVAHTLV